jgi:putative transposase
MAIVEDAEKPERIARVVRVYVIKPLDGTWEEVGPTLHKLRYVGHRCLNVAMRELVIADAEKRKASPYKAIVDQLAREAEREPTLSIASAIVDTWCQHAVKRYQATRKAVWKGDVSIPSFRKNAPIMVRKEGWGLGQDDRGFVLETRLTAGRTGRTRFAVFANGGSAIATCRALVRGEVSAGDLKLLWNEKHRKWGALLTVLSDRVEMVSDPSRILAVHRGRRVLLQGATSDGQTPVIADGGAERALKDQMHRRRRSWYAQKRSIGRGSRGHGFYRKFRQYRDLEDKEARFMLTRCQQHAARVVKLALDTGCGTIVLDDWSSRELADKTADKFGAYAVRSWPFAQQRDCIEWAAKKEGLAIVIVSSAYESITCPKCKSVDASQDNGRGTFRCVKCDTSRSVDAVAAWNMLSTAGVPSGFEEHEAKVKEFASSVKKK